MSWTCSPAPVSFLTPSSAAPDHRLQKASWNIWKTPDRCSAQFLISSKFLSYQLSFSHVLSAPSALRSFSILPRRRGMFNPLTQAGIQSGTPGFAIGDTGKRDWGHRQTRLGTYTFCKGVRPQSKTAVRFRTTVDFSHFYSAAAASASCAAASS